MKSFVECSFLIPIRRDSILSDGKVHARTAWQWFRGQIHERFSGITLAPGSYLGFYMDPETGERIRDRSRRYVVALPRKRVRELRAFLSEACAVFHQKCIYLSVAGRVEFIKAKEHGP